MRILMVSAELWPLAKVGGLADMVGALAGTLRAMEHDVRCAIPRYAFLERRLPTDARVTDFLRAPMNVGDEKSDIVLSWATSEQLPAPVLLVDHALLRREGIYADDSDKGGYPDNPLRWALFCRGVHAALGEGGWRPEIVHGHDHQAAPLLGLIRWGADGEPGSRPATVYTIHNLGYQGIVPPSWISDSGLSKDLFYPEGPLEFHGDVNLMKIGIEAADQITTVSPRYAREITLSKEFGHGLEGVLSNRTEELTGILNGIDPEIWNPETDEHTPFHFSSARLEGKARNRTALRKELGLPTPKPPVPLVGMVGRLASQKGMDLVLPVADRILEEAQMVVLGTGEETIESALKVLEERHRGRLAVRIDFDEGLAHRVEAGTDIFLMPSRYEPCGLSQLYSLRYGTVPVVRAVGGLADTVVDLDEDPEIANGFVFRLYEPVELLKTVRRAIRAWRNGRLWRELMRRGMEAEFSWFDSARRYVQVYDRARDEATEA